MISIECSDVKTRRLLARITAFVTVAAAIGTFLGPASAEAADHQPDGWTNRKPDIGSHDLGSATTQAIGSREDGWTNPDVDISAFGSAMTEWIGSRVDGWANRDVDIGEFASAMVEATGTRSISSSTWGAQGTPEGGDVIGSDF